MSLLSKNGRTIEVPRIYRDLDLSEYADGLPTIKVWVNPPRRKLMEFDNLQRIALQQPNKGKQSSGQSLLDRVRALVHDRVRLPRAEREVIAWYAELWSADGVQALTEDEVLDFAEEIVDQDEVLWGYMTGMTWRLIQQHRESAKKNYMMRSSV